MLTLAVDTSSKACSCALFERGRLLSESYLEAGLTHSRTLAPMITETLSRADKTPQELGGLAVNVGPGSYTGLRIGVATVKGMALALPGVSCVAVSTLESLAWNLAGREGLVCAALDARVGQVFAALFEVRAGRPRRLTDDDALTLEALEALLARHGPAPVWVAGDGAALVCERLGDRHSLIPAPMHLRYQRASSVGMAALFGDLATVPASLLAPEYLRKSQAERERDARLAADRKDTTL